MNGYILDIKTLQHNLDFVHEEIKKIKNIKDNLKNCTGTKSDDAITFLRIYDRILNDLNYLLLYEYDAEYKENNHRHK